MSNDFWISITIAAAVGGFGFSRNGKAHFYLSGKYADLSKAYA